MMRLLIDVGNSRIKWTCASDESLGAVAAVARDQGLPADLLTAWQSLPVPVAVWVASVAGAEFDASLAQWIKKQWGLEARFAKSVPSAYGITTRYREPQKLGVDRWVAMVAARERAPVCVIDCGTAITLDVLNARREHVGGLIIPGLNLMRASLIQRAPGIRAGFDAGRETSAAVLGLDTASGVRQGTLHAIVGAVQYSVAQIQAQHGPLALWITGGDGALIQSRLGGDYEFVPDLVLRGLLTMAMEDR